jgi:hypothetical protein
MATENSNVSLMLRGFLFLAVKYETSKETRSAFVTVVTAVLITFDIYKLLLVLFH